VSAAFSLCTPPPYRDGEQAVAIRRPVTDGDDGGASGGGGGSGTEGPEM
jgi:hypothetical protein